MNWKNSNNPHNIHPQTDANSSSRLNHKTGKAPILRDIKQKEPAMNLFIILLILIFAFTSISPILVASADDETLVMLPE